MKLPRFARPQVRINPRLDHVRDDLNRLKLLWLMSSLSPLIYLTLAYIIRQNWFLQNGKIGFAPIALEKFYILVGVCGAAALALQGVMAYVRYRSTREMLRGTGHTARLLSVYRRRTFALIAASEAPVLLGFLLFLTQGQQITILGFGIASLLYYAQSYPSETRLGNFADRCSAV